MLERRTFIVRVHEDQPSVEDAFTGERVRVPDLAAVADEIERRINPPDDPGSKQEETPTGR